MHDAGVKNSLVHARPCDLHHLLDAGRCDGGSASETRNLFFAFDIARITHHVRGIFKSRVGQPPQRLNIGVMINDAVIRATVGIESAADA